MSTTESDHIVVETEGRVRTLRINRPEKKNALTAAMYGRLTEELERAAGDPAIRVMVITGAGDTFTSGNDLNDFLKRIEDASEPQTGIGRVGRRGEDNAGDVPKGGHRVVVVEVAAEPPLVGVGGDTNHHRVAVLTVGEEAEAGGLTPELVGGIVEIGQVLDLGDGQVAVE